MSAYKRGNKWWVRFRFNHKRYFKVSPDNSQAGAKAYEALLRSKLAIGEPIVDSKVNVKTFQEFSESWMEIYVKSNNKHSEISNKECILKAHLVPAFGGKKLDRITTVDIEKFKAKKISSGLANKTINNLLIVLGKCLKTAQEWGEVRDIPRVKLLKVSQQKYDFLAEEESTKLLNECKDLVHDMVFVAMNTGLRFGELIALGWDDVDLKNKIITVRKSISMGRIGATKNNQIRHVPMVDDVYRLLLASQANQSFVFAKSEDEPLGKMQCLRWLHSSCRRAGLRKIGWHALRHTFASNLAMGGVPIMVIKDLLGHADIRTTMRYSHLTPLATKQAVKVLEKKSGDNMETIVLPAGSLAVNNFS